MPVGVAVGVTVGVPVGVAVGVDVPVGVGVGEPVPVGVGVGVDNTKAKALQLPTVSAALGTLEGTFGATGWDLSW